MGYCGCDTSGNKKRWGAILALLVTSIVLYIAWGVYLESCDICRQGTDECAQEGNAVDFVFDQKQEARAEGQSALRMLRLRAMHGKGAYVWYNVPDPCCSAPGWHSVASPTPSKGLASLAAETCAAAAVFQGHLCRFLLPGFTIRLFSELHELASVGQQIRGSYMRSQIHARACSVPAEQQAATTRCKDHV